MHASGPAGSNGTTGTRTMNLSLWDENRNQTTKQCTAPVNGWRICAANEMLVLDAGSRTKANLANFDGSHSVSTSGSNPRRITAWRANLEWIETPSARKRLVVVD